MQFVLIDDVPAHNDILACKLEALCAAHGWPGRVALKTADPKAVADYARHATEATAYFLDVRLEGDGNTLDLYRDIQAGKHPSYLIYVSAHTQYAMDCLHTHAFDFLPKPLTDEQLEDCLTALMRNHAGSTDLHALAIRMGGRMLQLNPDNVLYFSRDRMNVCAHCTDGSTYVWRESFERLLERLQGKGFVQCHRSYIVGFRHVLDVHWSEDRLTLQGGHELPVSRRRVNALRKVLTHGGRA